MAEIILKPTREKSLLRLHPWVFSGAVERVQGDPQPGETVGVLDAKKNFIAWAAYSPVSQIRARVWSFDEGEHIDADFFSRRIEAALALRAAFGFSTHLAGEPQVVNPATNAARLIHAESDRLPGVIVDAYGDVLVLQLLTAGSDFWRETIADILLEKTGAKAIYERSDADVRELEGLPVCTSALRGSVENGMIPIHENGLKFNVNIVSGHKTGFYLDQRRNRQRVGELSRGRDVLNCFCYTGGFSLHALAAGAKSVYSIDSSADALALGQENALLNSMAGPGAEWHEADVFHALRKFRDERRSFDMIILDPPKFAATFAQAEKAGVSVVCRRSESCAREHYCSRLPRRCSE